VKIAIIDFFEEDFIHQLSNNDFIFDYFPEAKRHDLLKKK